MNGKMAFQSGSITTLVFFVPVALLVFHLVARYSRLRHIPGPLLPSLTDIYFQWRLRRGENYVDILHDLHEKYGPVVRWGPNRVSFASTSAIPFIYGAKDVFTKAASYQPMVVLAQGQEIVSLVTIRDEARMSMVKSQISAGFSQSTWLKQEHQMDETLDLFIQRLHEQSQSGRRRPGPGPHEAEQPPPPAAAAASSNVVALDKWISLWTFDTLSELTFSGSRGFLAHGRDIDGVYAGSAQRFRHWKHWSLLPTLEQWVHKSWLAQRLPGLVGRPGSALLRFAAARIEERKRELGYGNGGGGEEKKGGGEEMTAGGRDLVGRFLAASAQNPGAIAPKDVLALTVSTIHAGADTTSSGAAHALANALSQPETWRMLEGEILGAGLTCPPAFKDVASLPVLDAVVRESLRISFLSGIMSERTITHDTVICDVKIPSGTDVSVSPHDASRDVTIYGPDADAFRPQRWIEADHQHWQVMEKASFVFLHGKRICIGRHLAWIEMKKVIATLILSFKISLAQRPVSLWETGLVRTVDLKVLLEPRA